MKLKQRIVALKAAVVDSWSHCHLLPLWIHLRLQAFLGDGIEESIWES